MTCRRSVVLAFATALAAGNLAGARASVSDATQAAVPPSTRVAATHKINPVSRSHTENQILALTTAEMIYLHESLVSNLVSVTPISVLARPVSKDIGKRDRQRPVKDLRPQ